MTDLSLGLVAAPGLVCLTDLGEQQVGNGAAARLVAPLTGSNLRLLVGMVRANRPWRFAIHLYRLLVGALAVAAFGWSTATSGISRRVSAGSGLAL